MHNLTPREMQELENAHRAYWPTWYKRRQVDRFDAIVVNGNRPVLAMMQRNGETVFLYFPNVAELGKFVRMFLRCWWVVTRRRWWRAIQGASNRRRVW